VPVEEIAAIAKANPLSRGVTFSGGEPFAQAAGFTRLAKLLKDAGFEVASYTGYTFEQLLDGTPEQKALLESLDVLIDGPFVLEQKSLEISFRGSRNQRILDVAKSLAVGEAVTIASGRWLGEY
jgi:anaerobic ribonucleoside-triphosphate reductase activating protein